MINARVRTAATSEMFKAQQEYWRAIVFADVGDRKRLKPHHVVPVSKDNALNDAGNIRIMTPTRYIEAHKGGKEWLLKTP